MSDFFHGQLRNDSPSEPLRIFGSNPLQAFHRRGNHSIATVSGIIANIADAMTACMRQMDDDPDREPATGTAHRYATCVRVEWDFLAPVAALSFLSICFFTLASFDAITRGRQCNWRSSPLAYIYHGPSRDEPGSKALASDTSEEMEAAARGTLVQLASTGSGWRLAVTDHAKSVMNNKAESIERKGGDGIV